MLERQATQVCTLMKQINKYFMTMKLSCKPNSAYLTEWSVCILQHVGERHNTSTAFTVMQWKWSKQCLLSGVSYYSCVLERRNTSTASPAATYWKRNKLELLLIEWNAYILLLVGETHNTSTAASTVTHWKWNKQCLLLLLSGVSALSIIAVCWRDTQYKHCIYCCDHWRPRLMTSDDHLQVSFK